MNSSQFLGGVPVFKITLVRVLLNSIFGEKCSFIYIYIANIVLKPGNKYLLALKLYAIFKFLIIISRIVFIAYLVEETRHFIVGLFPHRLSLTLHMLIQGNPSNILYIFNSKRMYRL